MTTIQKIAAALKAANEEIYAHVRYNVRHDTWEVWVRGKPVEVNFKKHPEAEDRCEEMNYEFMAHKVMEVLNLNELIKPLNVVDLIDRNKLATGF